MAESTEDGHGGLSRRQLMAVGGGLAASAAFLAACGSESSAEESDTSQFGEGDVGILNYALTLEHLEAALFADVIASGLFAAGDLETMRGFGAEEAEHVAELTKLVERMDGEPAQKPETEFALAGPEPALELIAKIENLVAAAYLGQVPSIAGSATMETVLSIHSVEGRHAAAIDTLLGRSFSPEGEFAEPAGAETVLASLEPFMTG